MPIDHPDWLDVVGGSWRYVGQVARSVPATLTNVVLLPQERAVLIKVPGTPADGRVYTVSVVGHSVAVITLNGIYTGGSIVLAYVNPAVDATWDVSTSTPLAGADPFYIFTDTALAMIDIAAKGPQLSDSSVPVVLALDSFPLAVEPRIGGVQVGVLNPLAVQPVTRGPATPYDSMKSSAPGAALQATVTFPATAGKRWVLDYAEWSLESVAGAVARVAPQILDNVTALYVGQMLLPVTANSDQHVILGPGAGYVGSPNTQMIVNFSAAPPANVFERLNAAAYLVT